MVQEIPTVPAPSSQAGLPASCANIEANTGGYTIKDMEATTHDHGGTDTLRERSPFERRPFCIYCTYRKIKCNGRTISCRYAPWNKRGARKSRLHEELLRLRPRAMDEGNGETVKPNELGKALTTQNISSSEVDSSPSQDSLGLFGTALQRPSVGSSDLAVSSGVSSTESAGQKASWHEWKILTDAEFVTQTGNNSTEDQRRRDVPIDPDASTGGEHAEVDSLETRSSEGLKHDLRDLQVELATRKAVFEGIQSSLRKEDERSTFNAERWRRIRNERKEELVNLQRLQRQFDTLSATLQGSQLAEKQSSETLQASQTLRHAGEVEHDRSVGEIIGSHAPYDSKEIGSDFPDMLQDNSAHPKRSGAPKLHLEKPTRSQTRRERRITPKGRKGCRNCKRRHIRCNEGKPECSQCVMAGLQCDCIPLSSVLTQSSPKVKFSQIQRWRTQCRATHGDCCNNSHLEALAQQLDSLLLIDVISACLVDLPVATPFVALSYVWGNVTTLKSVQSNLAELKESGALFREHYQSRLPKTIRDAMLVVRATGERYLWVDCLSIVQDAGKEQMDRMLKSMARIYASAEFTIVAARGENADAGLYDAGESLHKDDCIACEADASHGHDDEMGFPWNSHWASRGWTFQEALFSRRLLVFNKNISWICGRLIWFDHEGDSTYAHASATTTWPSERPHLGVPMGMMSLIPSNPTLGRWGMIVENFSSRNLTYEEDASRALAGASEVMSSTFPGGLYCGLPLFFFDIALLWQPKSTLERRIGEPSWSWTGWKGPVNCLSSWYPFYPGVYRKSGHFTEWMAMAPLEPLAAWSLPLQNEDPSQPSYQFNGFHAYQRIRYDRTVALPPGWERRPHPEGDYFINNHFAETGFQYAFPLPPSSNETQPIESSSTTLLCTAPTATAALGTALFPESLVFSLMFDGLCIGSVRLHSLADVKIISSEPCDLVAISAGTFSGKQDARHQEYLGDYMSALDLNQELNNPSVSALDRKDLEFYNVLCFTTENGIAYRRGLGMVSKRHWNDVGAKVETIALA